MKQGFYTLLFNDEKQKELGQDTAVSHGIIEKIYFSDKRVKQTQQLQENLRATLSTYEGVRNALQA